MSKTSTPLRRSLPCETEDLNHLMQALLQVRREMLRLEAACPHALEKVLPAHIKSARNLVHYLAMRSQDIRDLQGNLAEWGLSSLGRSERKVQAAVDTVLHVMHRLLGKDWAPEEKPPACFREGRLQLEKNTAALLGEHPDGRRVRIMVTLPSEAATDFEMVRDLLEHGMNCARINCAHESPAVWIKMIENIRKAELATGKSCKIGMDLGGPKLRTGPLQPGPKVVKVRPKRDAKGMVLSPGWIYFYPENKVADVSIQGDAAIAMPDEWLSTLKKGDVIQLKDARRSRRRLKVENLLKDGCMVRTDKTIYWTPGIKLRIKGRSKNKSILAPADIPALENAIRLQEGDILLVTRNTQPGHAAVYDEQQNLISPASIGCSIPEVLDDVQAGESIWFDDGKIGGIIESIDNTAIKVRITQARAKGERLRAEKGINLPDSNLHLPALTTEDIENLSFVVQHADMVSLSFINSPKDVTDLIHHLHRLTDQPPGIVLKIETRRGFDHLPAIILAGMQAPVLGVMIARGDLAIESGFGRLAEAQEEILWICEAAHVPVIWATQVLESLAKEGFPSRAEVTDAAMGQRAECIMLNKGEHILDATQALDDILRRMQDHQAKKRSLLRKLNLAENFFEQQNKKVVQQAVPGSVR